MAAKMFYWAKRNHARPLSNVYQRAVRALANGVPIGRGHPWQLPLDEYGKRGLPNWANHQYTKHLVSALKAYPSVVSRYKIPLKDIPTEKAPFEALLDKFLKRHPEVVWKVPYDPLSKKAWAPVVFAQRQAGLMKSYKLDEEDAYQEVAKEGGGGGDWCGIWDSLEHDRLKNILKKESQPFPDRAGKARHGVSLVKAYFEAKKDDLRETIANSTSVSPSKKVPRRAEKFLNRHEAETANIEFLDDMLDLGVLLKLRAIQAKKKEREAAAEQQANTKPAL